MSHNNASTFAPPERCLSSRFSAALAFAEELHAYERVPESGAARVAHLLGVCSIVLGAGADEDEAIAALLHEAVECHGGLTALARIRDTFGERVAGISAALWDPAVVEGRSKATWLERKRAYLMQLRTSADPSALLVSAADILQVAREITCGYQRGGEGFWQRFPCGMPSQLWYCEELLSVYAEGPPDARRGSLAGELQTAIERIKALAGSRANVSPMRAAV